MERGFGDCVVDVTWWALKGSFYAIMWVFTGGPCRIWHYLFGSPF